MFNGLRTTGGGDAPWPYLTRGGHQVRAGVDHRLSGGETSTPLREDADARRPLSPYAGSKKAAEAMAYSYHSVHGLDVTVLRF